MIFNQQKQLMVWHRKVTGHLMPLLLCIRYPENNLIRDKLQRQTKLAYYSQKNTHKCPKYIIFYINKNRQNPQFELPWQLELNEFYASWAAKRTRNLTIWNRPPIMLVIGNRCQTGMASLVNSLTPTETCGFLSAAAMSVLRTLWYWPWL